MLAELRLKHLNVQVQLRVADAVPVSLIIAVRNTPDVAM